MKISWKLPFWKNEDGTILAEALIVIPFVTFFAVGIVEFGNVFWQRHMLEVGVRDAARYWARCRPISNGAAYMPCSLDIARNIAFYGEPSPDVGSSLRVPNWFGEDGISIEPAVPPATPTSGSIVAVKGTMVYAPSPLFGILQVGSVAITYEHQERYYGW